IMIVIRSLHDGRSLTWQMSGAREADRSAIRWRRGHRPGSSWSPAVVLESPGSLANVPIPGSLSFSPFSFPGQELFHVIASPSPMPRCAARTILGLAALALAPMFGPAPAQAGSVTYTLNTSFNGGTPTSTPPWLTATFADNGANIVRLTLTAH